MTKFHIIYSILGLVLRFLPTVLDSGIQIWNGLKIDQMVRGGQISYPGPFFNKPRAQRSTSESSSVTTISLTEGLTFQFSIEGLVSIGLVQLPAILLALFGIVKAMRTCTSFKQGLNDSLHASVLMFLPFFIVEIISFFQFSFSFLFDTCLGFICGKCSKAVVQKFNFLYFLGAKDPTGKARMLCLDATKMFCGSCIQLCLQIVLLQYSFMKNPSQLLSILSSCMIMIKTSFEIITYQRNYENDVKAEDREEAHDHEKEEDKNSHEDVPIGKSNGSKIKELLVSIIKNFWSS